MSPDEQKDVTHMTETHADRESEDGAVKVFSGEQ